MTFVLQLDPSGIACRKLNVPGIVTSIRLARKLDAERPLYPSLHTLAKAHSLTTARVSQLLGLIALPREILDYIETLDDRTLGSRHLTERRARTWVVMHDPERQVAAFRKWMEMV